MSRGLWINALLALLGAPRTDANKRLLWAWWAWEGGGGGVRGTINPSAKYNWLNCMTPMLGSTNFNAVGVKNYPLWLTGVRAHNKTMRNGRYPDVIAAFRSGNPFLKQPVEGLSTWLSGRGTAGNPDGEAYARRVIQTGLTWKL